MADPILISVLVASIGGIITQVVQIYLDYKAHQQQGHDYFKSFSSNCCTTIVNENGK